MEEEKKVITSDPVEKLPTPGDKKKETLQVSVEVNRKNEQFLLLVYYMYKANLLSNNNVRIILEKVKEPLPDEGVAKFLVNEAAKVLR